ncbi:hypothetical protein ABIB75_006035 [Bradyrhizobium sp. GM2.2]|jgi:hypothetical protein
MRRNGFITRVLSGVPRRSHGFGQRRQGVATNADMRIAFDANSWMTSKKFCSKRVIAHSLPHLATTHTTTGNVTAASSVPSATAPDTGFTSR